MLYLIDSEKPLRVCIESHGCCFKKEINTQHTEQQRTALLPCEISITIFVMCCRIWNNQTALALDSSLQQRANTHSCITSGVTEVRAERLVKMVSWCCCVEFNWTAVSFKHLDGNTQAVRSHHVCWIARLPYWLSCWLLCGNMWFFPCVEEKIAPEQDHSNSTGVFWYMFFLSGSTREQQRRHCGAVQTQTAGHSPLPPPHSTGLEPYWENWTTTGDLWLSIQ